jgi:hypothetical protein
LQHLGELVANSLLLRELLFKNGAFGRERGDLREARLFDLLPLGARGRERRLGLSTTTTWRGHVIVQMQTKNEASQSRQERRNSF